MLSINPKDIPVGQLHRYLLSAVSPRPIAFASTVDENGKPNLSPYSFFNVFSANPPILIFSPARRVRDNTTKHTLENVRATKEVVINVVNHDIVQQMSLSSTEYDAGVNEFEKAGFTMLPSEKIKPFRVAEAPVQFECKVNDIIALGQNAGAGNLVICEVVKLHINESILDTDQNIDQHKLDIIARAGGSYYSRAKDAFFEIPKPIQSKGIGVDQLPEDIKNSDILSGNDLGVLANVNHLPNEDSINTFKIQMPNATNLSVEKKHQLAKHFIQQGHIENAWKLLLS